MRTKQYFSLILIVVGTLLLLGAAGYSLLEQVVSNPDTAPIPDQIAGLVLTRRTGGLKAAQEISNLHGKEFPLSSAAVGVYGPGAQVTLWVSGTPVELIAERMLNSMRARIGRGNSPFTPIGAQQEGGRTIFELDGMGQKHFYFRSGGLLIWLAADPGLSKQALSQSLAFYPP